MSEIRIGVSHTITGAPRPTIASPPLSQPSTMEPQFPLPAAPACRRCRQACIRQTVSERNRNGHSGRPYYTCMNSAHPREFSTWDDSRGIVSGNPRCSCRFTSRRVTVNEPTPGDFYSCPAGVCRFSEDVKGIAVVGGAPGYTGSRFEVREEAQDEHRRCNCVVM